MTPNPPRKSGLFRPSEQDLAMLRAGMARIAEMSACADQHDPGGCDGGAWTPPPSDDRPTSWFLSLVRSSPIYEYRRTMQKQRLAGGREIRLDVMYRCETYHTLITGIPHTQINDDAIHQLRVAGQEKLHQYFGKHGLHVLPILALRGPSWEWEPLRRPVDPSSPTAQPSVAELLPATASVATFVSDPIPESEEDGDYSALSILWLQHSSDVLFDALTRESLRQLDWNGLAENYAS